MAFLYNKPLRKILLSLILAWSIGVFIWVNGSNTPTLWILGIVSAIIFGFIWAEVSSIVILIFLSFFSSYTFFVMLLQYNFPTWLIMLGILIIFGYLFTYTEQKIGILGNKRLIYLLLFSIIILELFLILTYFLINPISLSLIIATISYLFIGFCYTILAKHTDNKFRTYILLATAVILLVFVTSHWGGLV